MSKVDGTYKRTSKLSDVLVSVGKVTSRCILPFKRNNGLQLLYSSYSGNNPTLFF